MKKEEGNCKESVERSDRGGMGSGKCLTALLSCEMAAGLAWAFSVQPSPVWPPKARVLKNSLDPREELSFNPRKIMPLLVPVPTHPRNTGNIAEPCR